MFRFSCEDNDGNPRIAELDEVFMDEEGARKGLRITIWAPATRRGGGRRCEGHATFDHENAKLLAIALDHLAFKIDPTPAALGVEGGEPIPSRESVHASKLV